MPVREREREREREVAAGFVTNLDALHPKLEIENWANDTQQQTQFSSGKILLT